MIKSNKVVSLYNFDNMLVSDAVIIYVSNLIETTNKDTARLCLQEAWHVVTGE